MAEKDTIKAGFDSYAKTVIDKDAGPIQKKETRIAFYSGAALMLHLVSKASTLGYEEGAEMVEDVAREIEGFEEEVTGKVAEEFVDLILKKAGVKK